MTPADPPVSPDIVQTSRPRKGKGKTVSRADILKSAAIMGDVAMVTTMLAEGLPINGCDKEGNSPLHHGAEHGHFAVVRTIVEQNGDVNAKNISLTSPLHVAVINGNQDVVSYLIQHSASINHHDIGGNTALHWAVTTNKKNIVKLLLKSGAVADSIDNNQSSPLHLAVGCGSESIIHVLLKKNANINQRKVNGNSPLHIACNNNKISIASALLNRGAISDLKDANGDTPLHIAVKKGNASLVELLLAHKANPTSQNSKGEIPSKLTTDEAIRQMLRVRKIKILDDDWCIVEVDKKRSLSVMEARDDEEKRSIIERFGQKKNKESYIMVLDSGKASVEVGLHGLNISKKETVINDNICCPVSVNSGSRASLIRKVSGFISSKLNSSDNLEHIIHPQTSMLRSSAPELQTDNMTEDTESLPLEAAYTNLTAAEGSYSSLGVIEPARSNTKGHKKSASVSGAFQPFNLESIVEPSYSDLVNIATESKDLKLVKLLEQLGLGKYTDQFLDEEWDWDTLLEITNDDLEIMGLKAGSRRKLMNAISRTRAEEGLDTFSSSGTLLRQSSSPGSPIMGNGCSYIIPFSDISKRLYLGKGFYGEVFLGSWNGIDVAVKQMNQSQVGSLDKWILEIELLYKLRHPNVVTFYCACTEHPNYCIVLEFASRGSLERVLKDEMTPVTHERRLRFLCDIARGIKYLHSQNPPIIHRDLKSDNILIDENWVAKVSDFGLSRYKDETYSYGRPSTPFDVTINPVEVLKNNHISEKADAYSFGLMMWEMYTRVRAFKNMNPRLVAEQVMHHGERPSMESTELWDPEYVALMKDCWAEDHTQRPMFPEILQRIENMCEKIQNISFTSVGYILPDSMNGNQFQYQ